MLPRSVTIVIMTELKRKFRYNGIQTRNQHLWDINLYWSKVVCHEAEVSVKTSSRSQSRSRSSHRSQSSINVSQPNPVKEASTTKHYNNHVRELANTDKEAHKELTETIAKFRDKEQEEDVPDDDELWWDTHYPPSHFYTLVYEDDDLSLFGVEEESYEENCHEVPDSTKDSMSSSITMSGSGDGDYTMSGSGDGNYTMPGNGSGSLFQLSEDEASAD